MIYTREELIDKIERILFRRFDTGYFSECANDICDLIATLNDDDKEEWKNIP